MNLNDLLLELSDRGVKMWAEEGQLRLRAPKGVLTAELQNTLSAHKPEILAMLNKESPEPPLERLARDKPLALSFMQERLWFLALMYPDGVAYNLPNAYRLRGPMDVEALSASLAEIIARHEALRTTFGNVDGEGVQRVSDETALDLELLDYSGDAQAQSKADQLALADANHAFDFEGGPLFLLRLVRFAPDDHLLLWTIHHIIADGWSSMIFLRELKTLYEARIGSTVAELPALPVQYADFAAWERRLQQGERLESQLQYWREKLTAPHPILEIPGDHPRPAVIEYKGHYHSFSVSTGLTGALKELSAKHRTTLFMTLLAAYKLLLHRYCRQDHICVGSPIARRNRPEIEDIFGCFINALPLRTDLSGDPAFVELLERVRDTCNGAFRHQDVPFDKVLETTGAPRDTSRTPLFQAMFILHVQDTRKITSIGGVGLTPVEYHTAGSKFDLTLELKETTDGLEGFLEYSTDLFELSTIERMARHFQVLLEGIAASPETRLSALPLLTEGEQEQLLSGWNATEFSYPSEQGVHELFTAQAQRTPGESAASCQGESLSYRELDERSNQLACHLCGQGVGDEMLVGICMDRSLDMLVGLLGILKAGAAYVPLDPSFPQDRLQFMVEDAAIGLLLTQEPLRSILPSYTGPSLCLDAQWEQVATHSSESVARPIDPQQLAYVIYTSGSTGKPKGVQIPHRALTNFLWTMAEAPGIVASDTLLAVTTLSFDIAGLELYLPLLKGAKVVIAGREEAADGVRLAQCMDICGVSIMQATPSTWRLLFESGWPGRPGLKVLCGGEALPRDLAEQILSAGMELWNMYGPTETTIWSAVERVTSGAGAVPIGRPIGNTSLYVLDDNLSPVPVGAVGELYIGGDGLARGYLNRPELTEEQFVASPFREGERVYRTGDLARYLPDGRLEVQGRTDHQVKVRGYRIELGEIEASLLAHPTVQDAVVIVREDVEGDKRIVAYVIAVDGDLAPAVELRGHLQQSLPDYMVPTAFVKLESFPLTPNNKVDRKALPAPDGGGVAPGGEYIAPRNEMEREIAGIWAKVLGVARVGIRDDFFDLGGHSLLAVRLVADMEKRLGMKVPLVAVFQGRNIEAILGPVENGEKGDRPVACIPLREAGSRPPFFAGGSNPRFQAVADCLSSDQPFYRLDVYKLQSEHITRGLKPLRRIEDMAAVFVEDIRTIQPAGPYSLGGGCEGGVVAFEVARQLQHLGEEVTSLFIWVMEAPQITRTPPLKRAFMRWVWQIQGLFKKSSGMRLKLRDIVPLARHEYIEYLIFRAVSTYRPDSPYQGKLTIARHYLPGYPELEEDSMGWAELATEGAEVYTLPGKHEDWLDFHAGEFAQLLGDILHSD